MHPDLSQKVQHSIEFYDYTTAELAAIMEMKFKDAGLVFEGQVLWLTEQISYRFTEEQRSALNASE